ncbi:MAG: 2-amino-4-hydroxy-6-hydroxymethyldihydropteridine diphosphokinase [Pseudomonadota bacterium]|nr:2-amino-4-hydroxy-6-hydroxymethyldihydropteridine diphosphokinase [Pseudomonadota bacterium]
MILIGLGSNIDGPWGSPREMLREARRRLDRNGIAVERSSALVETAPLGMADQPNFLNAVVRLATQLVPEALLARLEEVERAAGRQRARRWGPRTLDLDLLDHDGLQLATDRLILPHPEIANRPFVLIPLAQIAPGWRHPVSGRTASELLSRLPGGAEGRVLDETAW